MSIKFKIRRQSLNAINNSILKQFDVFLQKNNN
jgi:hypothetical protein